MVDETRLFVRLAHTHKPDCVMSLDGTMPKAVPSPDELAVVFGSDEVARYAANCRPIYEDLRRIIGQMSGLAILARLTERREIRDLPELQNCESRWKQASERLSSLSAPAGTVEHKAQLEAALDFCRLAMGTFSEIRGQATLNEMLDLAGLQIKRAYTHLQAASSAKAKLEMVDFSHACCCGR
ncbi:hypothetical protein KDA06_05285 [Candidatus Saccharibacteria bacterium]|nr:hypothetical protein [Candidatus Saccharibacteria bacterium]